VLGGVTIADSVRALRVLETSHPPVIYLPREDVREDAILPARRRTFCEFKGVASYLDVVAADRREPDAAWTYPDPVAGYEQLAGHVAFYPSRMDACLLGDERVLAQEGDFYGGWVTREITGPMKGGPGTLGW
jgi:uncharacterized protein (DUF427 family)